MGKRPGDFAEQGKMMNAGRASKYILSICAAGLFFVTFFVPNVSAAFRYLQEGMKAPVITGRDLRTGAEISSEPQADDRLIVITFWATWSQRSLELLADLQSLQEQYADQPFRVIAVNVDREKITPEIRDSIDRIVDSITPLLPQVIDDGLQMFYEYGVIAVPSTAVIDSAGILRYAPSGYSLTVRDRLVDTIEVLLGLKTPTEFYAALPGYEPHPRAMRYYRLAVQLLNQRMYERAAANLVSAMAADSNFSAPHNLQGEIYLELDSLQAAIDEFRLAVERDTNSVAAWAGWGRALLRNKQPEQAYKKLAVALARSGSYTPALVDLALCLAERGDTDEAIDSLQQALELNPKDPVVHYFLGRVYRNTAPIAKTVESYRRALELLFPAP